MQKNEVLDLTLAEVRKLIKRDQDWRENASCLGLETNRFIRDDDLRGKNQLAIYKESIEDMQTVSSQIRVSGILL